MQFKRLVLVVACVLGLAAISMANTMNDPSIRVGGGGFTPFPDTVTVSGNTFSFDTTGGSPPCTVNGIPDTDCSFINGNNYTWTTLTFFIDPVQGNLSCDGGFFFANCTVNDQLGIVTFSGGSGIGPGGFFQMFTAGFQDPTGFSAVANSVPEPASLILVLTGAGALLSRRRRQ